MLLPVTSSSSLAAFMPLRAVPMAENSFISQPAVDEVWTGRADRGDTRRGVEIDARRLGRLTQPGQCLLDGAGAGGQQVAVHASHGVELFGDDEEGGAVFLEDVI